MLVLFYFNLLSFDIVLNASVIEGLMTEFECVTVSYGIECSFLVIITARVCYYHQKSCTRFHMTR